MISRTRRIVDGLLLIVVTLAALWIGNCYKIVSDSKNCNVLMEYTRMTTHYSGEHVSQFVGSGVVISEDGYIVTAGHCVRDVLQLKVTLRNGETYDVKEYYVPEDPNVDFGIIKLDIKTSDYRTLGDSDVGGWIYNIGNAGGIWEDKFTIGSVYKNHFKRQAYGDTQWILAKLPIQQGCSGGGVYKYSRLIGIVSMKPDDTGCLIVPSNVIKALRDTCIVHTVGEPKIEVETTDE